MKKKNFFVILFIIIYVLCNFYLTLPALNLTSPGFWGFVINNLCVFLVVFSLFNLDIKMAVNSNGEYMKINTEDQKTKNASKFSIFIVCLIGIIIVGCFLYNLIFSPLIASDTYSKRIFVEDGDFTEEILEVNFSKLPLLDKDSSMKLGDRTMGEMSEWVSQFIVSDLYTQINFADNIVRVTPLEYDGIFKYFGNKDGGVKGYITVDSVSGTSSLIKLDKGMKYMQSAYFSEDLFRKLRFTYLTENFGEAVFEVDEEGNPFWIIPTFKYKGIGLLEEVNGIIVLDPITGKSTKYDLDSVPSWVDHVYPSDLIISQIDDWGTYVNGFFNSIFGQKNVVNSTDGYNYLTIDEDVYLYTGITSVLSDESNLGFMLVNLRTKEAKYYPIAGAEEFSAMASAEGLIQEKGYSASFPLLINLGGNPTYMLSLKDSAGLVKMYAFVNVVDYQIVSATDSSLGIEYAANDYLSKVGNKNTNDEQLNEKIKIKEIYSAVVNGNTVYYIESTTQEFFSVNISIDENKLPFLKIGDSITINYIEEEINKIIEIID